MRKNKCITHKLHRVEVANNNTGAPGYYYLVKADTKFDEAWYIIDTAASFSIFHNVYVAVELNVIPIARSGVIDFAVHNLQVESECFRAIFWGLDRTFLCTNLSYLRQKFELPIVALIGSDVLDPLNAIIDLGKQSLVLSP